MGQNQCPCPGLSRCLGDVQMATGRNPVFFRAAASTEKMVHVNENIAILGKLDEGLEDTAIVAGIDERALTGLNPIGQTFKLRLKVACRANLDAPALPLDHIAGGDFP